MGCTYSLHLHRSTNLLQSTCILENSAGAITTHTPKSEDSGMHACLHPNSIICMHAYACMHACIRQPPVYLAKYKLQQGFVRLLLLLLPLLLLLLHFGLLSLCVHLAAAAGPPARRKINLITFTSREQTVNLLAIQLNEDPLFCCFVSFIYLFMLIYI